MVYFHAEWCEHCASLMNEWKNLAHFHDRPYRYGTVDCDVEGKLCKEHGVSAYPLIYMFFEGKIRSPNFLGGRSTQILDYWARGRVTVIKNEGLVAEALAAQEKLEREMQEHASRQRDSPTHKKAIPEGQAQRRRELDEIGKQMRQEREEEAEKAERQKEREAKRVEREKKREEKRSIREKKRKRQEEKEREDREDL